MNSKPASSDEFWALMSRMYKSLDHIRESSNRIVELATTLHSFITKTNDEAAHSEDCDLDFSPIRKVLGDVKKEVNSILSYAYELSPHLKYSSSVPALSNMAHLLVMEMNLPEPILYWKLKEISLCCDLFAQSSNRFTLNPTKKSLKVAFGVDIGIENAKLKAYLESYSSNF